MAQPNNEPRRRYKLRVNFVGADAYDADENVRPYRKLIYLAYATQRIGNVRQGIEEMFTKLYPEDSGHKVMRLRDSLMCDVSDDFLVSDVFDDSPEVYAAMEGLTVQSSATIQPGFGSPNGGTGDRPRITVRPKRKRYTLTPSREDSIESSGIQVEARNGTVNAGYEGLNGSKSARLATGSASRRGTSLESDSPELTPFSPKTLATHDSVLAKRLFTASDARNGSILTTAPLISDIWDNVDVDASVALPPCAVVTATHAESDDMVAATVLLNGFGPPAPALRLQNTEDAIEKNSDSEEDDILQNDSMAVPRTNGRTANPTPKKATAKILLPTRRSARIARSYSGGSSRQYSGSIRFDSEPPTCCDVGRGTTRKRKVAELSDSDESKDETDVESDSLQIPAMLPGSQVKDKQPTPQHSADPVPVAVADVETSETETVDRTATPSVVPEVSDPIDAATQQQTEPVALDSDPESNEENHLSTEKDAAVHPNSDSGSNEEDHSSAEKDVVAQPDSDSRSNEEGHSSTENDVVAQQDIDPRSNEEDHLSTDKDVAPQPDSDEASLEASAPAEPTTPEKRSTRSTSLQTKQADSKPEDDSASEDSAASEASEDSATADSSSESVEPDSPAPAEPTTPEKRSTRSTSLQTKQAESKPEEDSASEDSAASDSLSESVESDSPAATETELEPLASEASPKPTDAKVAGPYSGEPEVIPSMPESAVVSTEAPLEKLSNDESTSSEEDTSEDESTSEEDDSSEEESSDEESSDDEEAEDKAAADIGVSAEAKKTVVASSSAIKPIASKAGASSSPAIKPIASKTDASAPPVKAVAETASKSSTEASEEDTSEEEESDEESSEEESSDDEEAVDEAAADIGVSAEAKKSVVAPSPAIKPTASKAGASPSPAIKPIASKTNASAPPVKAVAETASTSSTEASEEASTDEESSDEESSEEESSDEESSDDEEAEDEVAADTGVSAEAEKTVVAPSPAIKPTASKTGVSASPVKAVAGTASTSTAEAKEEETADEESSDEESSEEESSSEGEASSSEEESSEESEDESESEAEKEANPTPVAKTPSIGASQPAKKANVEPVKAKSSSQPEKVTTTATVKDAAKDDSSSEDESESEEDSDSSVESDSSLESESEESDSESDKSDADSTAQQKPTKATNVKGAGSATDTPKPPGPVTPPPKVQPAAELRTPTQAGRRSTLASPPLSSSRRKIQLSKPMTPVEESESASEDDSDPPPRKLDKLPILGTPSMSRRTSGVLELAKNQRGGLRDGSGVKSISQIAGAKPYDELRKQMAKVAASRSSSSSQLPTVSFDIKAKDDSSDSESSESDSDSDSDSDSSSEEEMPAKGGAAGKQAKPPAMPGKRPQPIRFAGATKLTASAKARRRTSALLNL
ncbi:hypothetical protein GGF45_000615 [Coemansia sp. RSA 551]|nr:hypothetical protein GGF45_000615 [Coemansia sp. RSA 551]